MKLPRRSDLPLAIFACLAILGLVSVGVNYGVKSASAEEDLVAAEEGYFDTSLESHYVTIYDDSASPLTIRTDAPTVSEALSRAGVEIAESDAVEPGLDSEINADNFKINIYRAYPVLLIDGASKKYVMTSKHENKAIFEQAGYTIYDGDTISEVSESGILTADAAKILEITRGEGNFVTVSEEIPFEEVTEKDYTLAQGTSKITQYGETGLREAVYEIKTVDGKEVSRTLISENVTKEAVPRITAEGARTTTSVAPEREQCAEWVRAAGVAEEDVLSALDIIYHESGCRVNAANASGAYGIPQALPGSKMASAGSDWETNPVTQIRWMAGYVQKYGGWSGAVAFWYAHGWY